MSLHKNTKRGKCFLRGALEPFLIPLLKAWDIKLPNDITQCDPDCVLYRKGMRYWEQDNRNEPFEECAINIIADSGENQIQRTFAMQQEMGETKNAVLFQAIARFADSSETKEALLRMVNKAGGISKLITKNF